MTNDNTAEQLKCRDAFEEWANGEGFEMQRTFTFNGEDYQDLRTQCAWEAWEASKHTIADSGEVDIDAMCKAFYENKGTMKWEKLLDCWKDQYRSNMRAALKIKE